MTPRSLFQTALLAISVLLAVSASSTAFAQVADENQVATLRGPASLTGNAEPPRMARTENDDIRRPRNYPEQPPTIPHKIDGYQVDIRGNQCLSCHARGRIAESGAPMVSITHFMDREGQFLATVSPRRYFCNQCHVTQQRVPRALDNTFVDIDSLLAAEAARPKN